MTAAQFVVAGKIVSSVEVTLTEPASTSIPMSKEVHELVVDHILEVSVSETSGR